MKKGIKLIVALLVLLVVLAVLKPSEDNFRNHIYEKYNTEQSDDIAGAAENTLKNLGKAARNFQSQFTVEYHDKIFFALASTYKGSDEISYLGIAGFWVKIS